MANQQANSSSVSGLLAKLKDRGPMQMNPLAEANSQKINEDEEALMQALGLLPEAANTMQPGKGMQMQMPAPAQQPKRKPQALKPR